MFKLWVCDYVWFRCPWRLEGSDPQKLEIFMWGCELPAVEVENPLARSLARAVHYLNC